MRLRLAAAACCAFLTVAAPANAAVTLTFSQVGSNVVLTGTGSLNLTGATLLGNVLADGFVNSGGGTIAVGGVAGSVGTAYRLIASAGAFGTGGFVNGSPDVGTLVGIDAAGAGTGFLYVQQGYVSGSAINGSTTFANRTFASLGLTGGTYTYRIANDAVTIVVPGGVPEPATWAMMMLGFGFMGAALRRRAKMSTTVHYA